MQKTKMKKRCRDGVTCVVLCTLPSIYLVCVVFGTAIPTSFYIFGKCFSYLYRWQHTWGARSGRVVPVALGSVAVPTAQMDSSKDIGFAALDSDFLLSTEKRMKQELAHARSGKFTPIPLV